MVFIAQKPLKSHKWWGQYATSIQSKDIQQQFETSKILVTIQIPNNQDGVERDEPGLGKGANKPIRI